MRDRLHDNSIEGCDHARPTFTRVSFRNTGTGGQHFPAVMNPFVSDFALEQTLISGATDKKGCVIVNG